jgi:hypothetical protein
MKQISDSNIRHHKLNTMKIIRNIAVICSLATLGACANFNGPKGNNTTRAQFLDEVWVSPSVKGKTISEMYSKVYFTPVATGRLKQQGWWAAQNSIKQEQLATDARKLASRMNGALVNAARNDSGRRLQVVSQPGPGTLIVDIAITELVPAKAYWNAAATAAGFVVPGAGLRSAAGSGSVAIEGRLRDGNTRTVIASFRDRMTDKMAVVNLDSYSWYAGSEKNLEETAVNIARVLNSSPGTVVNQSAPIKLAAY